MASGPFDNLEPDKLSTHGHRSPVDGPCPPVPGLTGHKPQMHLASFILYFFIFEKLLEPQVMVRLGFQWTVVHFHIKLFKDCRCWSRHKIMTDAEGLEGRNKSCSKCVQGSEEAWLAALCALMVGCRWGCVQAPKNIEGNRTQAVLLFYSSRFLEIV